MDQTESGLEGTWGVQNSIKASLGGGGFPPVEAHAREEARVELLPVCGRKSLQERAVGDGGGVADLAPVILHAHRARLGKRVGKLVALLRGVRSAERDASIQYAPSGHSGG